MKEERADIALLNGAVYTVNPRQPWAEAVALKKNRILRVGSEADIKPAISSNTKVIELKGDLVLPGFIDSHTHFIDGGFALSGIQLRNVRSKKEFIACIKMKVREMDKGKWVLNGDWNHLQFDHPKLPNKEWVDKVTQDNPVCVDRMDKHAVFVNSLALKIAGITKNRQSPEGGIIEKDPVTGEPTGILKDSAIDLIKQHIPEASLYDKKEAVAAAVKHANSLGVTSVHDMQFSAELEVYQEMIKQNKLTARLCVYIPVSEVNLFKRMKLRTPFGNDFLKIGGLKGFVDGSLGSFTALFFHPYEDASEKSGLLVSDMFPEGIMEKRLKEADKAGLQVAIHAIGDRANHIILDIFERVAEENEKRDRRWRIEHAQHLMPEDIERIAKMNVIASVQPYQIVEDGVWAEERIGAERARTTYAFKSLLEKGAALVCGSDWTVAPLDPIKGIFAAVTRRTREGKHPEGWIPEEKISVEDAVKGYTLSGAYAEFAEDKKGSLEPGKLADIVVLDKNLFKIPLEEIINTRVGMTIFDGKIVYEKTK
jgi:predicted amidohydrolase YtcJ